MSLLSDVRRTAKANHLALLQFMFITAFRRAPKTEGEVWAWHRRAHACLDCCVLRRRR